MILAIDFGGTRTRAATYDADLHLLHRAEMPTRPVEGAEVVLPRLIDLARSVIPAGASLEAVGVSAGCARAYTGMIDNAPTLPGWVQVPLAARLIEAFGLPVRMENDANLAALAEVHLGAAQGCDPAIYLTLSTGVGGGVVIGGQLFTGWRGVAFEPGHLIVDMLDGGYATLEGRVSGPALAGAARDLLNRSADPSPLRALGELDGKAVAEAARLGDPLAVEVVEAAGRALGVGLVNVVHLFNPQCVVLGGSVASLGDLLLRPARAVLTERLIDPLFHAPDLLRVGALGDDGVLLGAALLAKHREEITAEGQSSRDAEEDI
jgi:glucokinase